MNKVATYLNEHLAGEVIVSGNSIAKNSTDKSQLLIAPEMIAQVANTNDIRKIMSFLLAASGKGPYPVGDRSWVGALVLLAQVSVAAL